ncbi:MAG: S8 family serine peptidase [Rubrivivax sp.]|nr:S8 family serine peptidase [Rubrivivax sp.]
MFFARFLAPLMIASASLHAAAAVESERQDNVLVEGSYIVTFKPSTAAARSPIMPALPREQLRTRAPAPFGEHTTGQSKDGLAIDLDIRGQVASIFDAINAAHLRIDAAEAERLRKDPRVLRVEQNMWGRTSQTVQVAPGWALDRLDQPLPPLNNQYIYNANGDGQTIYILDSGLDLGNAAVAAEFGGRATVFWDVNGLGGLDCLGHGTQVASAAAGTTRGLAKGATLIIAKITTDCTGNSNTATWTLAFNWLAANAPRGTIANLSSELRYVNGACAPAAVVQGVEDAIRAAHNAGIIVVVSAGNDGCDTANFTPARIPEAFVVGATDFSRFAFQQDARTTFSRFGTNISAFAPGQQVPTITFNGQAANSDGTSFSAPFMSGMFAVGCQVVAPACTTEPVANLYAQLRGIGVLGSVVNPGGGPLPAGTTSRFIPRAVW